MTEPAPTEDRTPLILLGLYLVLYAQFGALTVSFYPSYSYPNGDEGTYLSYARDPWELISGLFEGYRPKEVMSPYAARLFLNPFSVVFALFGFTHVGARLVVLLWGLLSLVLMYQIVARIHGGWFGLLAAVLFSLSPPFLFFTHGIRPEGMFVLFLLLITWIIIRRDDGPNAWTYGVTGFLSASMLLVHYNGVLMPLLFFPVVWYCDRERLTLQKVLAYGAGGAAFLVVFAATTFLPALSTVSEFGLMPVTFYSSSDIPVLHKNVLTVVNSAFERYSQYFHGALYLEPQTPWFTTSLAAFGALALAYRSNWRERGLGLLLLLILLAMIFLIPNRRPEYIFYPYPFVFMLAACGLARLPYRSLRVAAALAVLIVVGGAYVDADIRTLTRAWRWDVENQRTGAVLQELVAKMGDPRDVTVMGPQDFHVFVPETRYRTFHSVITTEDLAQSLRLIDPDIVVVHERTLTTIGVLARRAYPGPRARIRAALISALSDAGYVRVKGKLKWDGRWVEVWVRERLSPNRDRQAKL